jgi:protein TonB
MSLPPSEPAQENKPLTVDGQVQAGKLIKQVAPVYPPEALSARLQGDVHFVALIAKDGSIRELRNVSGNPLLMTAAQAAAKQWVYRPTLVNGEPVEVLTDIDVRFSLK